jgi:4-aminobutyrate aminotransferase-like enzyme
MNSFATVLSTGALAPDYMIASSKSMPVIVRGRGAEVEDEHGKIYLDLDGGPGVAGVGHCHPLVVAAVQAQAATLMQSPGRFHNYLAFELARRIALLADSDLKKVFFCNSGAEANDGATKLALKHAVANGKRGFGVIALEYGFHGRLSLPLSLTGLPSYKKGLGPYASFPDVVRVAAPYAYRCSFGSRSAAECGDRAADALRNAIRSRPSGTIAMMIAEPIPGVSGVLVPPDNYWRQVDQICSEENILLVMDEVFTGFGRTGQYFAHRHWGISPAIMTFAKAIGAGLPLGGFIATERVGAAFDAWDHNTTFGSNSLVGLAAATAVLDVLEREKLTQRAAVSGERLLEGFRRLQDEHACLGDVRGKGLMIGLEMVKDRASKTPAPELTRQLQGQLFESGLIVGGRGAFGNVLRLSPPLTLTDDQIEQTLFAFERVFAAGLQ